MDIVITLPKTVRWTDYQAELLAAEDGAVMNFKLPRIPKYARVGDRCYVVHDGLMRGYMLICGIVEREEFLCSTTGRRWEKGYYVQRTGQFHYVRPYQRQGFQGFRYLQRGEQ